ncbi:putative virion structural protein [Erwinia phage vB_EamM_RAY]|jgi:hypothetical protein|uniref:Virion structural protein n=8 Tax=Agricanvirus TaxID=1984776 RepID=A0A173GER5_9CAUD|nr:virion structural protein [Erwinia phage vB_EamM_Deimos-Minion]YP_009605769.1 virion structural protein [Erwinia phage vB_EamM_RAY]YP_009606091.1 virion structural protein [Erwinia phage vB_EamM_Simmy50]YP_009606412.1 virion structural protein [Erwinia phage vB_EamM_Special G]YP_009622046.1 virion structural protein [Erwinia phage vB_EamM_Desertfox]AUG86092.1 putative virion structural protein [Erwinia phage vB_EamM_Bosolaphorus]AUG86733.1 putative virion structural protein [Erwinia phage 
MTILNQPSAQIIVDQINQDNNLTIQADQINFGVPTPVTGAGKRDTDIPVIAVADKGYVGSNIVNLDRLKVSTLFFGIVPELTVSTPSTTKDLLATLNGRYGLQVTANDISDRTIDANNTDSEGRIMHDIVFQGSLVYEGTLAVLINTGATQQPVLLTESGQWLTTEDGQPLKLESVA